MIKDIQLVKDKSGEKILRKKTRPFDFRAVPREKINELLREMRAAMRAAQGIGLAANQVGLDMSVFVAEVPDAQGRLKFYAVFNPELVRADKETASVEEGCLSVPGVYGEVERPERVIVAAQDKHGKSVKIKAWGLLARVFQHEIDHLQGKLFLDRAKRLSRAEN